MFEPFLRLPLELRIRIWELATFPRLVYPPRTLGWSEYMLEMYLPENQRHATLPPPIMHACRESRRYAKYQKASLSPSSPQYIWANFENDVICVAFRDFIDTPGLEKHRSEVRRLRLMVDYDRCYDYFFTKPTNFLRISLVSTNYISSS